MVITIYIVMVITIYNSRKVLATGLEHSLTINLVGHRFSIAIFEYSYNQFAQY